MTIIEMNFKMDQTKIKSDLLPLNFPINQESWWMNAVLASKLKILESKWYLVPIAVKVWPKKIRNAWLKISPILLIQPDATNLQNLSAFKKKFSNHEYLRTISRGSTKIILKRTKVKLIRILNIYGWMSRDWRFIVIGTIKHEEQYTGHNLYVNEEFRNADNGKRWRSDSDGQIRSKAFVEGLEEASTSCITFTTQSQQKLMNITDQSDTDFSKTW
jgi:hypothetical protein